jgi:hypothetical protein
VVTRVASPSTAVATKQPKKDIEGPSTDPSVIYERLQRVRLWCMQACAVRWQGPTDPVGCCLCCVQLVLPYWLECPSAKWRLAGVVALTLGTTAVR